MERDFLGMKSEPRSGSQHAASLSSAVRWPFAMHQFVSYKVAEGERQNKCFVNSGLQAVQTADAFETSGKKFPTTAPQKFTRNVDHPFPIPEYHLSQGSDSLRVSACQLNEAKALPVFSHHAVPVAMSSPFFKLHGSQSSRDNAVTSLKQQPYGGVTTDTQFRSSMASGPASVRMPKSTPMTAQLTIFYAGSVNIFDDVSLEKAQEIMSLASKRAHVPPSSSRSEAAIQANFPVPMKEAQPDDLITKKTINPAPIRVSSPCPGVSSAKSVSSRNRADSRSSCSTTDDAAVAKTFSPLTKINQEESLMTAPEAIGVSSTTGAIPRAVPQARKASLARFLERRKDRMISVMPYSCSKNITGTSIFENGKQSSISRLADVNLASSQENFLYFGHAKSNITLGQPPSTKLEI